MNHDEQIAERYLKSLDRGAVVFEPDGNVPPDFLFDGSIAVEVRRLNQNHQYPDGSAEGLENLSISLWQRLTKFLPSLGPARDGESWWVGVDFRRPLEPWRVLHPRITAALLEFMHAPERKRATVRVSNNFELDLIRAASDLGSFFRLGASSDDDSGGWVMGEVEKNLRLCMAEKARKILPYRAKYPEWWLILIDYIDFSMKDEDREIFRTTVMPTISHGFDKIVLLDPRGYSRAFEIP